VNTDSPRATQHAKVWELLPWLVNGRLGADASAEMRAHLGVCAECAHEYAQQLHICGAMQADESIAFASEASFQKLAMRLDAASKSERTHPRLRSYAAAGVLAAVGLATWGAWSVHRAPGSAPAAYRTLTSPAVLNGAVAQVRVVFTPELTLSELARLLHSIDATITAGPSEAGVYTLGFGPGLDSSEQVAQRLALLRASDSVRFAEPVVSAP
jgi:hypothetical protein